MKDIPTSTAGEAFSLGPMPAAGVMTTVDEAIVRAPLQRIFAIAADVERWPERLPHYRYVRFHERRTDGGGVVEMSANRPFGVVDWPTWWTSEMSVTGPNDSPEATASIRFRHIRGITTRMEVEWQFTPAPDAEVEATRVRIVHLWDGPRWPLVGKTAAKLVIGPVFVHGIASRTLAGLARSAESAAAEGPATAPGLAGAQRVIS